MLSLCDARGQAATRDAAAALPSYPSMLRTSAPPHQALSLLLLLPLPPLAHAPCGWLGGRGRLTDIIRRPRDDSVVPGHRDSATAHQRIRAPKHPSTPSSLPPVAPSTAAGLLLARYRRYLARQVLTWNRLQFFGWNAVAQRPHSLVSGTGAAGARARSDAYQQLLF